MRLSDPAPLMRDSALDSDIVWHEYGHGLTWRMIGGMSGAMAGAIGEGMGDVLAILINEDDRVGEYAASDPAGIRSVPYGAYNKTYKTGFTATEVHLDGELYGAIGWRLLQNFGDASKDDLLGYMVDGMNYTPSTPNVRADARRHPERASRDADDECKVWDAFADFGVGVGAQATRLEARNMDDHRVDSLPAAAGDSLIARRSATWSGSSCPSASESDRAIAIAICNLERHDLPRLHALIRRQHDPQAVDGVVHVIRQVHVLLDGPQEERLLPIAQPLVIGFVLGVDELVGPDELVAGSRARCGAGGCSWSSCGCRCRRRPPPRSRSGP